MKGFKLYFYQNNKPILFSSFQEKDYGSLTFDENLEKELNDRHTLTFSTLKEVGITGVQLYNFLKVGKKIRLEYDQFDSDNYVDFIISSVSPVKTSDNILYNFTCEDYASFKFTRNNIGLNLNTFDDEDWLEYLKNSDELFNDSGEPIGNIISIGNYLLERGTLRNGQDGWKVICDEESKKIPFNIELSDSNTYNGLVEIANLTHTNFFINYKNKTIDFKYKGSLEFYKNYVLSPELNLQDASFNYDGNDFYSILYVSGTDNEYDVDVGLTPTLTNKFFTWIKNSKINNEYPKMTIEQYRNETFYDEFLSSYNLNNEKEKKEHDEIKIINKIPYLDNFIFDFDYFQEAGLITKDEHDEIIEKWILNDLRKINIDYQRLYQINDRYNYNIESTLNKMINTCELLNKAKDGSIKEHKTTLEFLFMSKVEEEKTFNFFDYLSWYRGTNNIIEFYLERIKQELIENIKERNNLIESIDEIELKLIDLNALDLQPNSFDFTDEIRILQEDLAGSKSLLSSLEEEVGSWDYIPNNNTITMGSKVKDHGFITDDSNNNGEVIELKKEGRLSLFFRSFVDFLNEYSSTDYIPVDNDNSLYKQLQDKLKEKEKFWFDFKEEHGDVLIEGFYHNDLESKPEKLWEYADLYFRTYKKPKDDYSIEYLDASDVLGTEVKNIDVGDYISISKQDIDFVDKLNQDLRVASISRNLRSSANISLTIDKIQKTQLLLEKMIIQSYK